MRRIAAANAPCTAAAVDPAEPMRALPSAAGGVDPNRAAPATPLPHTRTGLGRHTLHVEHGRSGYRIIHTRPNGTRVYWRRAIRTYAEALLRARVVEDLTGYEVING